MFKALVCVLLLSTLGVHATFDKDEVKRMLYEMAKHDQELRSEILQQGESEDLFNQVNKLSEQHIQALKSILSQYNWITISEFGLEADYNAWLLVQHADDDVDFQIEVLRKLEQLYPLGETSSRNFAYLYDRVAQHEGRPQRYGTQGYIVDGQWEPYDIEDVEDIEVRRASMGMKPFKEYVDMCRQVYGK